LANYRWPFVRNPTATEALADEGNVYENTNKGRSIKFSIIYKKNKGNNELISTETLLAGLSDDDLEEAPHFCIA